MDWIMEPSILAYNMYTRGDIGLSLDDILNEYMPGISIEADFEKYQQLVNLIISCGSQCSINNTGWSYNHNDIIDFLKLQPGQKVNIFNVDHHHDLGYEKDVNKIDCSNWVYYLHQMGYLNTYYWIGNKNSQFPMMELDNYIYSTDIGILQYTHFDKIFVSFSPNWIPKKYHPLCYILADLLKKSSVTQDIDK